ncbi:MAG: serine O-acetyltransferase [Verrucomicrobium sp.]|nr:serine O-acetyltransferase [Verrucomicrobium sp.]
MAETRRSPLDALLDSYAACGGINHLQGANLPSRAAVGALTEELLHLLFPGFFSGQALAPREVPAFLSGLLDSLRPRLEVEIAKSLEFAAPGGDAAALAEDFLEELAPLRAILQTDVEAAFDGDPAATSTEEVMLAYPGIEAIAVQRMAHLLYKKGVPLLPRMMTEWAHGRTGIDIHPGAEIGTHFFIDHGTGIVIGETCKIGDHAKIYHGVTLGARSTSGGQQLRGRKRHPTLEDHVTIYPGATILGGETVIGARTVIGGNVWLVQSVPPDSQVILPEQRMQIRNHHAAGGDWEI